MASLVCEHKRTTNYTIITSSDMGYFESEVKRHVAEGWELQGGVFVGGDFFYQAMQREEVDPEDESWASLGEFAKAVRKAHLRNSSPPSESPVRRKKKGSPHA